MNFNKHSYLYYTFIGGTKDLEVCKSAAGYYIGVQNYCRDSVQYYKTLYEARAALSACSWTQRLNP